MKHTALLLVIDSGRLTIPSASFLISTTSVLVFQRSAAWARLIKKVYEVDPLSCPRCGQPLKVLAVITDPAQVLKILRHLIKIAKPPSGLEPTSLN